MFRFDLGDWFMDKLEFVDSHIHFYDMQHPELVYGHWQPGVRHPSGRPVGNMLIQTNNLVCYWATSTTRLNMHEAKTHLSAHVARLKAGDRIILCRRNRPVVEILPLPDRRTNPGRWVWARGLPRFPSRSWIRCPKGS